ncbi:hypothetical protein CAPTEDRAFT_195577 [Capitella teleta]|uniref:Uncharacterized protein n=1 Tax=Capitella teleta TaxID=283909 RepID=R7UAM9_CAPTE|nr:hypothetical protein CAPTEDRAFT_195577 [Capitella teleta]|eukprot:ELU03186.1 hypothetical protein CAPTEDRAFT_195577 [Capitella teleta]
MTSLSKDRDNTLNNAHTMHAQQIGQEQQPLSVMQTPAVVNQEYAGQTRLVSQNNAQVSPDGMMQVQQPQYAMQTLGAVNQGYTDQAVPVGQSHQSQIISFYQSNQSSILGVLHVVVGVLSIGFGGAALVVDAWGAIICHGIWGGVLFIITGVFATVASKRKDYCNISIHLSFAIVSMITAVAGATISIIGCADDGYYYKRYDEIAMNGVLAFLLIIELALTIWSAIICGVLCGSTGDCCTDCGCYGDTAQYADPGTRMQYMDNHTQQLQITESTNASAAAQTVSAAPVAAQQEEASETPAEGRQSPMYYAQL